MAISVNAKIKDFFFDRLKVIATVEKQRLKFLSNVGGFTRKTARNSMRRKGKARKKPKGVKAIERWEKEIRNQPASKPGSPPFAHSDDERRSLKYILYAFNMASSGVVVGPVGFEQKTLRANGGTIPPELHEYGGTTQIPEKAISFPNGGRKWVPLGRGAKPGQATRRRAARYPARPYMRPAVQKAEGKFKDLWFSGRAAG